MFGIETRLKVHIQLSVCQVIRQGTGEIIPWRQPSEEVDARNYLPCPLCLGFFLRADLWKHQVSCRKKITSNPSKTSEPSESSEPSETCDPSETSDALMEATSDHTGKSAGPADEIPSGDTTTTKGPMTCDPRLNQSVASSLGAERPKKRIRVQAAASRLLPISSGASESCSEVLHRMNVDHVSHQVCLKELQ